MRKYLLIALLPLLILLGLTVKPVLTYTLGEEILLKTQPVDPYDLFRGRHMVVAYEISSVASSKMPGDFNPVNNEGPYNKAAKNYREKKLYAVLKKEGSYHTVDRIVSDKPKGLHLPCSYQYVERIDSEYRVRLDYQLDKYFIPENSSPELEDAAREGKVSAKVKVYNGYPLLVDLSKY
ncbi:GDYXXLXY domain-containing protein [Desulfotomaculum sp. 1211_IL3151]|uniref:GDYXXLXY domain-containing protein n=1 Tax=Desulfotomaculum sp. 1211_IL3151 TaxID=3084055 RepID=UPI002FD9C24E